MHHLLTQWPKLTKHFKNSYFCIFLDFDGTLAKITNTPQQACLSKETKNILKLLAKNPKCQVVVVSGRTLKNIKILVGIKEAIYAGNHGMEFGDSQNNFKIPISLRYKTILKKIKSELISKLGSIKGVLIEDKKVSLSLHYRLADTKDIPTIKTIFNYIIAEPKTKRELTVLMGKKVLEIVPPIIWHKGKIVSLILVLLSAILKKGKIIALYVGDDKTDENAFMTLKNKGITVFVGNAKETSTHARYYLKNTQEVKILLEKLNSFLSSSS